MHQGNNGEFDTIGRSKMNKQYCEFYISMKFSLFLCFFFTLAQEKEAMPNFPPGNHIISGPMGSSTTSRRTQQRSILASAFKDAWKQGNLASDVKYMQCIVMLMMIVVLLF